MANPKSVAKVKSFHGLAVDTIEFVQDFSKITRPLTKVTRKKESYVWTEACVS